MNFYLAILRRDVSLAFRDGWQAASGLLFFVLVVMMLAFGIGTDPMLLRRIAPGAIWTAALLASLLSLDRLFAADHEDGTLDRLLSSPIPAESMALAKMLAHWLTTGLPLTLFSPAAALLMAVPLAVVPVLMVSLALGTLLLTLIGGAIAALMVGSRRGGLTIALLALPLYVPVLIFGASALDKALAGGNADSTILFLAAMLALALPLAPLGAAAALQE
jgi:heme exporter protein B